VDNDQDGQWDAGEPQFGYLQLSPGISVSEVVDFAKQIRGLPDQQLLKDYTLSGPLGNKETPGLNFVGNIEGGDLPAAKVDVVVTDGFTGNVALKVMEGAAKELAGAISDVARQNPMAAVGGMLLKPSLGGLRKKFDPDTTGGAILLGLRATAVVGHGSSGAEGIANAVRLAARCAEVDAVGRTAALINNARE